MPRVPVIGLEVHVQLATGAKLFCGCRTDGSEGPNQRVCAVCVGLPGALPVPDPDAVELALRLVHALHAEPSAHSVFDRKNYFYPDLPKGYQITQQTRPLATGGRLPLLRTDRVVPLRRLHLEEDAGRLVRLADGRLAVDFDRAGVPLVEIVTEPALRSAEEAQDALRTLTALVVRLGVNDGALEDGNLRCDVNVSLETNGVAGQRTEVKNVNSFRFVARAVDAEIRRQEGLLKEGRTVRAMTLGYDDASRSTIPLRGKEEDWDYRFFPEPDLEPLLLETVCRTRSAGGTSDVPWLVRDRLLEAGLDAAAALFFAEVPEVEAFLERVISKREREAPFATTAEWVRSEVPSTKPPAIPWKHLAAHRFAALLDAEADGTISRRAAKELLPRIWETEEPIVELARRAGLLRVTDPTRIERWLDEVEERHPDAVARYRAGHEPILGFLIGQAMSASRGSADPHLVRKCARRRWQAGEASP